MTRRSIGALLAGFFTVVILSIGTDVALRAASVFPPLGGPPMSDGLFVLATLYRTLYSVAGSYITARLAPYRPMGHAMVGGVIGLCLSIFGAVATWNQGAALGPRWYPLSLVVLALPCAWAGGWLRLFELRRGR